MATRINIAELQHRPDKKRPWLVRWTVDGRSASASYPTKAAANSLRSRLETAAHAGLPFDPVTRLPVSWAPAVVAPVVTGETVAGWVRRWHVREWPTSSQRTRRTRVEALARFAVLAVRDGAPKPPKRPEIYAWLNAHANTTLATPDDGHRVAAWFATWSVPLTELTPEICDRVATALAVGEGGRSVDPSRYRKVARQCLAAAVELKLIPVQPWTPPKRGKRRKTTAPTAIDIRILPEPAEVLVMLKAMVSHQPASQRYQRMAECIYLSGMRPSEVLDLRCEDLTLPATGWGSARVAHSDQRAGGQYRDHDDEDSGETKTGRARGVPLHPALVRVLRAAVAACGGTGPLWVTRTGGRPTQSNWHRCWDRARGPSPLPLYGLRHVHATIQLRAGVPLGEVARRLGHTVETLVRTYSGVLEGDERIANALLEGAFD